MKCYMCDAKGTTKEHVPPRSFFPVDHRLNLTTVPSCETHNNGNSVDVEYVRNIIVNHFETNEIARKHFKNKIFPLYQKSEKLKENIFKNRAPVIVGGKKTIAFQLDMPKFLAVMKAIAYAVYFKDYGESYNGDWIVYSPSMVASKEVINNLPDPYNPVIREMIASIPFLEKQTNNPQVFKYSEFKDKENGIIYKFEFYEGFIITAFMPTGKRPIPVGL